jgi:ABC-2 type transport system ATP-binding protein
VSSAGANLALRGLAWLCSIVVLLLVGLPSHDAPVSLGLAAVPVGLLVGAALFAGLARSPVRFGQLAPERAPAIVVRSAYLSGRSAFEEVVWRGLLFASLLAAAGVGPALGLSTAAFALSHYRAQSWRMVVHLATGAAFGGLFYVSGSLLAAVAAHATYNVLIGLALEARRETRPFRPIGASAATTYDRRRERTTSEPAKSEVVASGVNAEPRSLSRAAELQGVVKRFHQTEALRGVDLEVRDGEILALLGPNGAGKTTAIGVLTGLRRPDAGIARLFGRDPCDPSARGRIGVTPQEVSFPPTLRVAEVVDLVRAHYAHALGSEEVLTRFGLSDLARRQAGGLSGGQRRRLALALAFAGAPKLAFLDEPTTGLDVEARRRAWQTIREHAEQGSTVLLTTHDLHEADALATRIAVMGAGRVLAEGTPTEIRARAGLKRVRLRADSLPALPGVVEMSHDGGRYTLYTREPDEVIRALVARAVQLRDLEVGPVSLEEAFLHLTGGAL